MHCYTLPVSRSQSYKVNVVLGVCCALIGQSHSSGGRIGSKIERAVNPFHPIVTCPAHSSDMSHVTIDPCTGQSAESERYLFDPYKKCIQSNNETILDQGTPIKTSLVANIRAAYDIKNNFFSISQAKNT